MMRPASADEFDEGWPFTPLGRWKWDGKPDRRVRCTACDKVVFGSRESAEGSAERIRHRAGWSRSPAPGMKAYLGACGQWHLARK